MFACARDIALSDRKVRGGVWGPLEGVQLLGKTLGVIGLGGIGREVARIGAGIGMTVIGWNRTPRPEAGGTQGPVQKLLPPPHLISPHPSISAPAPDVLASAPLASITPR